MLKQVIASPSAELFACAAPAIYPVAQYRRDFPILNQQVHGKPLAYLDNAASTQRPRMVTEAVTRFSEHDAANIHRGVHELSMRATQQHDAARETVRRFIGAAQAEEIVFTRNGTEAVNLVASSWGNTFLQAGDEIILTLLEHHSNIVPWQLLQQRLNITLRVAPITPSGEVTVDAIRALLTPRTRLIACTHVSNVLGTILPVADIVALARTHEKTVGQPVAVLIDGCQAVARLPVDMRALDADFYVFSGHKLYGPTGIGVLYGKSSWLNRMPPYQGGGGMIASVSFTGPTTFAEPPYRFEAGTPAIAEAIGLAAAIDYVTTIGLSRIGAHEDALLASATERLRGINSLTLIGTAPHKAGVLSFTMQGAHPHDIGTILDRHGVAIRAGHHCAQPLMDHLNIPATARASFGLYNTADEIDALAAALQDVQRIFG